MNSKSKILSLLPYDKPFLFVDEIIEYKDGFIKGHYTFPKDAEFYKGHFKHNPVTPGVLLTECAAQIGLVCYALFKFKDENRKVDFGMTSVEIDFSRPHFPGEKVTVEAEEIYHRFGKLKMKVTLFDDDQNIIARGKIAGMPINYKNEK
jgi:3-hydroxyacyl-[acyl-carrier-protein] dehydratase